MDQFEHVDHVILQAIDIERALNGSCTAGAVARRLRIAKSTIVERCGKLREKGLVTWTPQAGSLQRVGDAARRMYELRIIDAVEQMANEVNGGLVTAWCRELLVSAHPDAVVEPEVVVVVVEAEPPMDPEVAALADALDDPDTGPERTGDEPPAGAEIFAPPQVGTMEKAMTSAWYCAVCDQSFKTRVALLGHERASKVHLAKSAQTAPMSSTHRLER